jgi:hypothetical protein
MPYHRRPVLQELEMDWVYLTPTELFDLHWIIIKVRVRRFARALASRVAFIALRIVFHTMG